MLTASRPTLRRVSLAVATVAAASIFTSTAAHASPTHVTSSSSVAGPADDELPPPTAEEEALAAEAAEEINRLGLSEGEIASALESSDKYALPDFTGLRDRLLALPTWPTAQQTAQAIYPGDASAQASILPVLADEQARAAALLILGERVGVTAVNQVAGGGDASAMAAFGWWEKAKYLAKCGGAIGIFLLNFTPSGSSVKVVRAYRLIKSYGVKKAASIIWRFVKGKNVTSKERRLVTALLGIPALAAAC
ncbi:hypothetical protein [Streptomyces sp. Rer75]|uniref:hypothetical protein n=1 Tax=unclassified Streptomyces TaxID=2593676 RepID=UPI0015D08BF1|nr:hypothetical protein [Streptomyces sp. Rer75]QLH22461.1 hypothetical protein HYQ63_19115 [Streptomyces sp. Rer75]